jgi:hypothetical protein
MHRPRLIYSLSESERTTALIQIFLDKRYFATVRNDGKNPSWDIALQQNRFQRDVFILKK